ALADSKDVPIRMADVHLAYVPGHVGRRPGYLDSLSQTLLMDRVDVMHPPAHPAALVVGLVLPGLERGGVGSLAAAALSAVTPEEFAGARANGAEANRVAPAPELLPAELGEPGEAGFHVRDVEDRGQ